MNRPRIILASWSWAVLLASCARVPLSPPPDVALRVMSYNIKAGAGDLDGTAAAIRTEAPDLVGLQEVDVHWSERSAFADQATTLAQRLGMQVRFAPIYQLPGADASAPTREYGVALLSRYPIVAFTNHAISRLSTQAEGTPPSLMPGFLEATVDVRGTHVRVFNTHLDYRTDPAVRRQQVTESLVIIGEPATPTLMFGDFNAGPDAPELQPLLARMRDSWPATNEAGLTYPSDKPVKRIDFVLTSGHFRIGAIHVPVTQASDHRPVVADLVVGRKRD